ncbi:NAD(P)-binding domain-containing protein [Micrococcales bacterium 31B]|nr:NAD(P)-binding domain-containing protein [Micrococcales bacterium 31B]
MTSRTLTPASADRVLVIGAGAAGLAAAAELGRAGIAYDIVDGRKDIGGNFSDKGADSRPGSALLTSRDLSGFEDLFIPGIFDAHPRPSQVTQYLQAYAAHHGIANHFTGERQVRQAIPMGQGTWEVTFQGGEVRPYRAVIVATGRHGKPVLPEWATRSVIPADRVPSDLSGWADRDVLIVGGGNTAASLAVAAVAAGARVTLSWRRGYWVFPTTVMGISLDAFLRSAPKVPTSVNQWTLEKVLHRIVGTAQKPGFPEVTHRPLDAIPLISDSLVPLVSSGKIKIMPDVTSLDGDNVSFSHGVTRSFDVIVAATGSAADYSFIPADALGATTPGHPLDLYLHTLPRERNDLAFVGDIVSDGALFPLYGEQAKLAVAMLRAHYGNDSSEPNEAIAKRIDHMRKTNVAVDGGRDLLDTPRHRYFVDAKAFALAVTKAVHIALTGSNR